MINPNIGPFGGMFHILGFIVWAFASLIALAAVVAILVLLVRFLIVGTRAAKLYIANNSPAPVTEEPAPVADKPAPVAKRTPKAPPAA